MPKRLSVKLILSLTILVAVIEAIFTYVNVTRQERQLLDNMVLGADQLSRSITSATWHAMLADQRRAAYEVMQTIATKQGIDRIRIFNKEGSLMYSTDAHDSTRVDKRDETCAVCHGRTGPPAKLDLSSRARTFADPSGTRKLAMITPIYNERSCSESSCHAHPANLRVLGVLDVTMNLDQVDRELAGVKVRTVVLVAAEILIVGLFIALFTRRFVQKPILKLIAGTKAVSRMNLDTPIEIDSSEELGELAWSFNVMRGRLKQAVAELNELNRTLETKVEDRTEQLRSAQQKLIRADRLASLGQLAASVAHEINNPVSGILNLSMLVQRILKEDGASPDKVAEIQGYLAQITSETTRVGRIVSDMLAFSRRSMPQRGPADLNALIRNTLSLVAHKLELSNVLLETDLQADLPPVPCDSSQMQQVVMNLVLNGAEAIRERGTVRAATRLQGPSVILEISDTGSGIAPEHLSKIFDPFFTTKEEGKGVGLGLAVVYGIVHAHGGDIEVESRLGSGTKFRVTLPLSVPAGPSRRGGTEGAR